MRLFVTQTRPPSFLHVPCCRNLECYDFMYCTPAQFAADVPVLAEFAQLDHLEVL
jgi:hypothetical protein